MQVQPLGQEDPLEEKMAVHSVILAWRLPWTEEPAGYSPWGRKDSDRTEHACIHVLWRKILHTVNPQKV